MLPYLAPVNISRNFCPISCAKSAILVSFAAYICDKCSAEAEMGDRFAVIDMGRGLRIRTQACLRPCIKHTSPAQQRKICAEKLGGCCAPVRGGELGPYQAHCGLSRGQPPYQVESWSVQPFGNSGHGRQSCGIKQGPSPKACGAWPGPPDQNRSLLSAQTLELQNCIWKYCIECTLQTSKNHMWTVHVLKLSCLWWKLLRSRRVTI